MKKIALLFFTFLLVLTVLSVLYVQANSESSVQAPVEYISFYQYLGEEFDMVCVLNQDLLDGTLQTTDYIDAENDKHLVIAEMQLVGESKVTDYKLNIGKLMYSWTVPGNEGFVKEQVFSNMEDAAPSLLEAIEEGWKLQPEQCQRWEVDPAVFEVPDFIQFKQI